MHHHFVAPNRRRSIDLLAFTRMHRVAVAVGAGIESIVAT